MQGILRICAECGHFLTKFAALAAVLILISGCDPAAETVVESTVGSSLGPSASALPEAPKAALCGEQGYLSTDLFGALAGKIEWAAADFECEGMPRPNGDGARLRFAGYVRGEHKLAIIISMPGLRAGETGTEYQSKVTIIEEGVGRFFTTGDNDVCWTDITALESVDESESDFAISGTLYCVAPLAELNGDSDITIRDLRFRGALNWGAS